jgi:hypothetical protein
LIDKDRNPRWGDELSSEQVESFFVDPSPHDLRLAFNQ